MLSAKSVIPECYIDSCLFDVLLGFEKRGVNHAKGNATVIKKMENSFNNLFCIGIVDKDRRDLKVINQEFKPILIEKVENYFLLFQNKNNKHHYLIQVVPAVEEWICRVSEELEIIMSNFDILASNTQELIKITKKVDKKDDPKFKALFHEFLRRSLLIQYQPVLVLKNTVKLILEKNYGLDINELKNA